MKPTMKLLFTLALLLRSIPAPCQTENKAAMHQSNTAQNTSMLDDIHTVSPALERYAKDRLFGDLWKRPDLSPRDRCIVTLAALIARNQTVQMPSYLDLALDNGVKPGEISEIITHLAFYSGCGGTRCRRSLLRKKNSASAGSGPISFLRPRWIFFL